MARLEISSVSPMGREERIDDNFVELYSTVFAASANYAATVSAGALVSGGAVNGASANFTATCSAAVIHATGAVVGASASFTATCAAATFNGVTLDTAAWSTYTPTVTASSGTFTSVSAAGRYKKIGRVVHLYVKITITTNGTASGFVQLTNGLPVTAANFQFMGVGRANSSGKSLNVILFNGTDLTVCNYDSTYPGATGEVLDFSITYESAA